mgnify:CR=1 FL=1
MDQNFNEDELLRGAVSWQKRRRPTTSSLGETGHKFLGSNLRRLKKSAAVVDAVQQLLPEEMALHCRIAKVEKGIIVFEVEPGPYMHEMRVMIAELLEHLKEKCGRNNIKNIKLVAKSD